MHTLNFFTSAHFALWFLHMYCHYGKLSCQDNQNFVERLPRCDPDIEMTFPKSLSKIQTFPNFFQVRTNTHCLSDSNSWLALVEWHNMMISDKWYVFIWQIKYLSTRKSNNMISWSLSLWKVLLNLTWNLNSCTYHMQFCVNQHAFWWMQSATG